MYKFTQVVHKFTQVFLSPMARQFSAHLWFLHWYQEMKPQFAGLVGLLVINFHIRLPTRPCFRLAICFVQQGLATAYDLAVFRLVNHSRTVASMRETCWENKAFSINKAGSQAKNV